MTKLTDDAGYDTGETSQGLRIAPPEAPVTGYMFGKGVYFADMVSKSANYCFTCSSSPEGMLLLCEVALGRMHQCNCANGQPLSSKFDSRKGCGTNIPDSATHYTSGENVVYPIGKPIVSSSNSNLFYNEYIVYNTSQIKQKYLIRFRSKFNH
ncbi:unnamed protein product [Protopolystoma xenopodis]|uniref:Poly [ADP-ribose] polymerase n=1 Tax=Protopolystoma xenopodis TaxID=117903 RepID=A0A448XE34_9PLAT|nr:unnamed protein product [Protopolystoma xenopodis]